MTCPMCLTGSVRSSPTTRQLPVESTQPRPDQYQPCASPPLCHRQSDGTVPASRSDCSVDISNYLADSSDFVAEISTPVAELYGQLAERSDQVAIRSSLLDERSSRIVERSGQVAERSEEIAERSEEIAEGSYQTVERAERPEQIAERSGHIDERYSRIQGSPSTNAHADPPGVTTAMVSSPASSVASVVKADLEEATVQTVEDLKTDQKFDETFQVSKSPQLAKNKGEQIKVICVGCVSECNQFD